VIEAGGVFLIGDIGGTHARLSLLAPSGRVVRKEEFHSGMYPSLDAILRTFLGAVAQKPKVRAAAFGIAGPVVNGRCAATNQPRVIDARVIGRKHGIKTVTLLNDLVALSLGAVGVSPRKLHLLNDAGAPKKRGANIAVIAAGTGLGEAMLIWDGEGFVPNATEGGHADFAPRSDLEVELFQFLRGRFGRVSWERVLSGGGLGNLYDFFRSVKGVTENADNANALSSAADRNAMISHLGLSGKSEAATRALELFASIYGAEAGNLALKALALGGVFVCGNIAASMKAILDGGGFQRAFRAKGRFSTIMESIPVALVLDSAIGLAGAKSVAMAKGHR
jgi:glucokinase